MTKDVHDHIDELLVSTLAPKERAPDQSFIESVGLAVAEEERFRESCRTLARRTLVDVATLLTFGGMFVVLLQAVTVKAVFEKAPSLLVVVALAIGMLTLSLQRQSIGHAWAPSSV